ncbi:MAG: hypothetical protein A2087_00345 [Spirochaetes bacterium GWD1_61_31]|nr:MAG: hypothetical protein A2Y37_00485 [Spirochaetes bacterium GWB1_60_80]OHD35512.1 MAG: hypothetical protein A2004_01190 [Spirochaetes bacterium GWC1_61_12]OHD39005.1 MAG: hypothetical protein A2087_00345 [Spirochaetes bacterium GWD1_61_31]OHD43504.1 MAG: hypothetical protein A2Y35_14945 [Spirochaetes bacterium GWE1_60_18]OHD60767.1 MAG: hypothetical protein A2Y32_07845 [Spirochaetes bacterium GWF1_60_12]HAP44597.1 hypothetical protein [Spirochaetaceae bacterium]
MLASFRGINLCAVIATKPVGQPGAPGQDPAPLAGLLVWTWRLNLRYFLGRRESALSLIMTVAAWLAALLLVIYRQQVDVSAGLIARLARASGIEGLRWLLLILQLATVAAWQFWLGRPLPLFSPLFSDAPVAASRYRRAWQLFQLTKAALVGLLFWPLAAWSGGFIWATLAVVVGLVLAAAQSLVYRPGDRQARRRIGPWPLELNLVRLVCGPLSVSALYGLLVVGLAVAWYGRSGPEAAATWLAGNLAANLVLLDLIIALLVFGGTERSWRLAARFRPFPVSFGRWQFLAWRAVGFYLLPPRLLALVALLAGGQEVWRYVLATLAAALVVPTLFAPSERFSLVFTGALMVAHYGFVSGFALPALVWPLLLLVGLRAARQDFGLVPWAALERGGCDVAL